MMRRRRGGEAERGSVAACAGVGASSSAVSAFIVAAATLLRPSSAAAALPRSAPTTTKTPPPPSARADAAGDVDGGFGIWAGSFRPAFGTELGGTDVLVVGAGFSSPILLPPSLGGPNPNPNGDGGGGLGGSNVGVGGLACHFGDGPDATVPATVVSDGAVRCSSPPRMPGQVNLWLSLSLNRGGGGDAGDDDCDDDGSGDVERWRIPAAWNDLNPPVLYEYAFLANVHSVRPPLGPGGTVVAVSGAGFLNVTSLLCRFGSVEAAATYVSEWKVLCTAPTSSALLPVGSSSAVTVSNNGVDVEGDWSGVTFTYAHPPVVTGVVPRTVPTSGGTVLTVAGENFVGHPLVGDADCRVGGHGAAATVVSDREVRCVSPAIPLDSLGEDDDCVFVDIEVSIDGGTTFTSGSSDGDGNRAGVFLHRPVAVTSVRPTHASELGGTALTVRGANFPRLSEDLTCTFGDRGSVPAKWLSSTELTCVTFPTTMGTVNLTVSTNGQDVGISSTSVEFAFSAAVTVSLLRPSWGTVRGGTEVTVLGTGFESAFSKPSHSFSQSPSFVCRFGNTVVIASEVVNSTVARCPSPPSVGSVPGPVPFSVSTNGGHDFAETGRTSFAYVPPFWVGSVSPKLGPASGRTRVRIVGGGFSFVAGLPSAVVGCRFRVDGGRESPLPQPSGAARADGVVDSDGSIVCRSPALSELLAVNTSRGTVAAMVEVTLNGVDFVSNDTGATFTYYPDEELIELHPSVGTEMGGTEVTVTGTNFLRSKSLKCMFGDEPSPSVRWVSSQSIVCTSPKARREYVFAPAVSVTVSINGRDFGPSSLPYSYRPASHIFRISPTFGSAAGGSLLHITGGGFVESSGRTALCAFGSERTMTKASVVSGSLATCLTPPSSSLRNVSVSLTFNAGHDVAYSDAIYTYVRDPVVVGISPAFATSVGGTVVTVLGENFGSGIPGGKAWCSVGDSVVEATVVSETEMTFTAPAFESGRQASISISLNGVDYTPAGPSLDFYPPPRIHGVSPPFAYEFGGTVLKLSGAGFHTSLNLSLSCIFKDGWSSRSSMSNASVVSDSVALCSAPASTSGFGPSSLGVMFSHEPQPLQPPVAFEYRQAASIHSIDPTLGPLAGGTKLTIMGHGFYSHEEGPLLCSFWSPSATRPWAVTEAQVYSQEKLRCETPRLTLDRQLSGENMTIVSLATRHTDQVHNASLQPTGQRSAFVYHGEVSVTDIFPESGSDVGGTRIDIRGSGFINSTKLTCSFTFGDDNRTLVRGIFRSHDKISCIAPPLPCDGSRTFTPSTVQVSLNGIELSQEGAKFVYLGAISVNSVEPSIGSNVGGTPVTISGTNLVPDSRLSCIFRPASKESAAFVGRGSVTSVSSTSAVCILPPLIPGTYAVELSSSVQRSITDSHPVTFLVHSNLLPFKAEPISGSTAGGTTVAIAGDGFINTTTMTCRFGNSVARAVFVASNEIKCIAPRRTGSSPSTVNIEVSTNGQDFVNPRSLSFTYTPQPVLSELRPSIGKSQGGTELIIKGYNLMPSNHHLGALVRFGNTTVAADIANSSTVICATPRQDLTGSDAVQVEVSTNGGSEFSQSGIIFTYIHLPQLDSLVPTSGLELGGNNVTIAGSGFLPHPNASCRFGNTLSTATIVSTDLMECFVPPAQNLGPVSVDVTLNGVDWTDPGLIYRYLPMVSFSSVSPTIIPLGTDVAVSVLGQNFHSSIGLSCGFGTTYISATVVSETLLTCMAPPSMTKGTVSFDITAGGSSVLHSSRSLQYLESVSFQIFPTYGPRQGGTALQITIMGGDVVHQDDLLCRFNQRNAEAQSLSSVAVRFNATFFSCVTPDTAVWSDAASGSNGTAYASLSLVATSTGKPISRQTSPFFFKANPSVKKFYPHGGDVDGGTLVRIDAWHDAAIWLNSNNLACRFGYISVPAKWVSPVALECTSPPVAGVMNVTLSVSENGVDFVSLGKYRFLPPPSVISASPAFGPGDDGVMVILQGTGFEFFDRPLCKFMHEDKDDRREVTVDAEIFGEGAVQCKIPGVLGVGRYGVLMSNNGVEFGPSFAIFESIGRPYLEAVYPHSGVYNLKTSLTVTGGNFAQHLARDSQCALLDSARKVVATGAVVVASVSRINCDIVCPPLPTTDKLVLEVSMDGANFTSSRTPFWCDPQPTLTSISPDVVAVGESGMRITAQGNNFRHQTGLSCGFSSHSGFLVVEAIFVTPATVSCILPLFELPGVVSVQVSNNGQSFGDGFMDLHVVPPLVIEDIVPRSVVVGAALHISGHNFLHSLNMTCKVGGIVGQSMVAKDASNAICYLSQDTVAHASVDVQISLNGITYSKATNKTQVSVRHPPRIFAVRPSGALLSGGTRILVRGAHFHSLDEAKCLFGKHLSTEAKVLSPTSLQCNTPSSPVQTVSFRVSVFETFVTTEPINFSFVSPIVVRNVTPASGDLRGGTQVTVLAEHFDPTVAVLCSFGNKNSARAKRLSSTTVLCTSPPQDRPGVTEFALVHEASGRVISIDGHATRHGYTSFTYHDEPTITRIEPSKGPIGGGTIVRVHGSWFVDDISASPACKFGTVVVPASLAVSTGEIMCESPPLKSTVNLTAPVSISLNGVDFSSDTVPFTYYKKVFVTGIVPHNGPLNGGTAVRIEGDNMGPRTVTRCRFGQLDAYAYYDDAVLNCVAPAAKSSGGVEISLLLQEGWHVTGKKFRYEEPIVIHNVMPQIISEDGERLRVLGSGFASNIPTYCRFQWTN